MVGEINLESLFKKVGIRVKELEASAGDPAQLVRILHRRWKAEGGKIAGKPRHSDRYLEDHLKMLGTPVKSLTPKLVGKTNIGSSDGAILIRFILYHWPQAGITEEEVEYKPIVSDEEIDIIADNIEAQLTQRSSERIITPIARQDVDVVETLPGGPAAEVIVNRFAESDAMITVSPEHIFVSAGPNRELIGFRGLMDLLRAVEASDHKARVLIWVLDLGTPNLDDASTRKKYLNVQQLLIRFKALGHYKDSQSEQRLDWLRSRASIILLDTYGDWGENISLSKRPDFSSHHATLSNVNPDWMADANFRALYGSDLDRVQQRVIEIFFNASAEWQSAPELDRDLRYFGFATFKKNKDESEARGLELVPLPLRYADAYRTICAAAATSLELKEADFKKLGIDGEIAIKQLAYLGFRVLRLDEFLEMY